MRVRAYGPVFVCACSEPRTKTKQSQPLEGTRNRLRLAASHLTPSFQPTLTHTHLFGIINLAGKPYQTTVFSSIFPSTDLPWIELVDDALEPDHCKQPAGESAQPGQQQDGERYQAGVAGRLPKGCALGGPIHADGQRACRAKGNWEGSVSGRLLFFHVTVLSTPTHTHTHPVSSKTRGGGGRCKKRTKSRQKDRFRVWPVYRGTRFAALLMQVAERQVVTQAFYTRPRIVHGTERRKHRGNN